MDKNNRLTYSRDRRVRKQDEFARVYQANVYAADENLVVLAVVNGLTRSRLGLAVSKRVGNAVVRNRWKRRIREAFRIHRKEIPIGIDLVVRPRKGAEPDFQRIARSLPQLAHRTWHRIKRQQRSK